MEDQISYYAVIPANVRYDEELPPNAKLLYGEITALCNQSGVCWASNKYFSELYGVSKVSISKWVKALEKRGYISTELKHKEGTKEIEYRYITILNEGIKEKLSTPIKEKLKENTTFSFNTTLNKKKERKTNGYDDILSSISDTSLRDLYLEYIKMRKLIKSPMTDRALQMLIAKVESLETNVERQKKLLETAIMNNWKSVYPLKGDEGTGRFENDSGKVEYGIVL